MVTWQIAQISSDHRRIFFISPTTYGTKHTYAHTHTQVLLAVGATAGTVTALALFATQTKMDLTLSGGSLLGLLFALLFASILQVGEGVVCVVNQLSATLIDHCCLRCCVCEYPAGG